MKRLLVCALLCTFATGAFAQVKKDTVLVITRDTTQKDKKSVTIRFGDNESKEDSTNTESKTKTKFSVQFIASRFDLGLSAYLDKGSFTLSPANSFRNVKPGKAAILVLIFFKWDIDLINILRSM